MSCSAVVLETFAYNLVLLAWMAVATTLSGFMLLPALHLHVVVARALLPMSYPFTLAAWPGLWSWLYRQLRSV